MVVIRLARAGSKKRPFYHVVVIDSRYAVKSGNSIERLGYFNPIARGMAIRFQLESTRIDYWIKQGAQPSARVSALIKEAKKQSQKVENSPTPLKTVDSDPVKDTNAAKTTIDS